MNAVPLAFRQLERVSRPAPFGIVFWDVATSSPIADGLSVLIALSGRPNSTRTLVVNRNAVWFANALPGISPADLISRDWDDLKRTYHITVFDTFGRFLPIEFDAELPSSGLYHWPSWEGLPKKPLAPLGKSEAPAKISPKRIPLFSAPGRTAPTERAQLRCELVDIDTETPAAWALVTAEHGTLVRGIGLADGKGRCVLFFGYPERPPPTIVTPPAPIAEYGWELKLKAYYKAPTGPVPLVPDLAALMAQLSEPRGLLASTVAPTEPLPNPTLILGRELVLKTSETPDGPTSSLFLAAA